ncbi:MAG: acyl--CoA ligase [Desulfobacteraceae bacterium]|nr:acyl--CoA ligase [Desulfobacteraceae bacterium]
MNLVDFFFETAENQPDQELMVGLGKESLYTYGEFKKSVESLADIMKDLGVQKGYCVAVHCPNSPAYISVTYALWRCGSCVIPIPHELKKEEKEQIFKAIRIDAVVSKASMISDVESLRTSEPVPLSDQDVLFFHVRPQRDHPSVFKDVNAAFIRFTSGTTGNAKGIVLSHETVYDRICAANQVLHIDSDDRVVWLLSMAYHFVVTIISYLTFGATIVFCKNNFGKTIIRSAIQHKATVIYGSPLHYDLMAHDTGTELLPRIRLAMATTTSLKKETYNAFYNRFKIPINETYGIIEIGLPCINIDQPYKKKGSVGRLLPAYEILMQEVDSESNEKLINLRGAGILDAYYDPWEMRETLLEKNNGWFATGDSGFIDKDGFLYIKGRLKEAINVGGMKFFPQEVEAVLEDHPLITEACVFGYPDNRFGEIPYAQIVRCRNKNNQNPTETELNEYCLNRLSEFKIPKRFLFVKELSRTASYKLIRDPARLSLKL